jgi:hypothetical protein
MLVASSEAPRLCRGKRRAQRKPTAEKSKFNGEVKGARLKSKSRRPLQIQRQLRSAEMLTPGRVGAQLAAPLPWLRVRVAPSFTVPRVAMCKLIAKSTL